MNVVEQLPIRRWDENISPETVARATASLEEGQVLFFPDLPFPVEEAEARFLSPRYADPKTKNISFDFHSGSLRGVVGTNEDCEALKTMLRRFATQAQGLTRQLFPHYASALQVGRTSYRPVEVRGRKSSYRKDDTRLHVDAFPSTPIQDRRILRVFTNINPNEEARVWRVGAPFEKVAERFLPEARKPFLGEAALLQTLRITKTRRTKYDHYMTQLHDRMKAEMEYQRSVEQTEISFPPGSTWMVFTDLVSHASLSGQYALEQTFYLPVEAMAKPSRSPQRVLERLCGARLI